MKKIINEKNTSLLVEILSVGLIFFIGYILFLNNLKGLKSFNNGDVHRGFQRGISVLNGVNPYLEFNPEQMLIQEKVPGFFPLYFYFMALIARVSHHSFVLFLDNLRYVVFAAYLGIGLIIYLKLRRQSKLLGLFGMFIFMFNRWTLNDVFGLKQDSYVLVLVLLSLIHLKKNKIISYFLFGIATAIKHLTVFISPIYALALILPLYEKRKEWRSKEFLDRVGRFFIYTFFLVLPILGPSIPFFLETPKHYTHSIMYQLTRESEADTSLDTGFDKVLVLYNQDRNQTMFYYLLPRAPMLIAFILLTLLLFMRKINGWKFAAFSYLIFVSFNPVLFSQYYTWLMAFLPFVFLSEGEDQYILPFNEITENIS